jgi:hypothetical protein
MLGLKEKRELASSKRPAVASSASQHTGRALRKELLWYTKE